VLRQSPPPGGLTYITTYALIRLAPRGTKRSGSLADGDLHDAWLIDQRWPSSAELVRPVYYYQPGIPPECGCKT